MSPGKPAPSSTPGTLRLSTLPPSTLARHTLRVLRLEGPGPRYARLRSLRAIDVQLPRASGAGLPATGLTWDLAGRGVALTLILGN